MKRLQFITLLSGLSWATAIFAPLSAQNIQCPDRPSGDTSNACANTRFVKNNGGGGGGTPGGTNGQVQFNNSGSFGGYTNAQLTLLINQFTSTLSGTVPGSGGGINNFLRADGTWAPIVGNAPVGSILPWTGATVPPTYLLAYGQAVSRTTYPDLLTTITFSQSITCTSGLPTITVPTTISDRVPIGAPIEASACFIAGSTVSSKSSGSLTISNNAIASTTTTAKLFPWGNGDGSTTFNIPDLQGRSPVGRDNMSAIASGRLTTAIYGSNPDAINAPGGTQSTTLLQTNLPSATLATTIVDPGHSHTTTPNTSYLSSTGGVITAAGGGSGSFTGFVINNHTTGITASTALGGSNTPFSTVQPSLTIDYLIKAQADSTLAASGISVGVTAISGGSTGNVLYDNGGLVGEYPLSTADQYNCATAGTIVQPSVVFQAETTTTFGATTTFDFCTFKSTAVTLTANITTQNLVSVVPGKAGTITFIQDATGSRTTVWNSIFKFSGGTTPTLTTTPNAVDILTYSCRSATFCAASLLNDVR